MKRIFASQTPKRPSDVSRGPAPREDVQRAAWFAAMEQPVFNAGAEV